MANNRKRTKGRNFVFKQFNIVNIAGASKYMNEEKLKVANAVYEAALAAGKNPNPVKVYQETRKISWI